MTPSPGWYPDPKGEAAARYWDGEKWTEQVSAFAVAAPPAPRAYATAGFPWRWVALGLVVLSILGLGVVGAGALFVGAMKPPADEANRYLAAVTAGDYETSFAMTCSQIQSEVFFEEYVDGIVTERSVSGDIVSYYVYSAYVEGEEAFVEFDVETTSRTRSMEARLLHEGGVWRWCGSRDAG